MTARTVWPPEPQSRRWTLFRRFDIIGVDGTLYLRRWRLFECPWFGILLHKINRPDHDRELHDHPWSFVSFVLLGGYCEQVPRSTETVEWVNVKRGMDSHRISVLKRTPTWTLVFRGPRHRTWGFYTENGWIPWHVFLNASDPQ